jgi:hypothetical protein
MCLVTPLWSLPPAQLGSASARPLQVPHVAIATSPRGQTQVTPCFAELPSHERAQCFARRRPWCGGCQCTAPRSVWWDSHPLTCQCFTDCLQSVLAAATAAAVAWTRRTSRHVPVTHSDPCAPTSVSGNHVTALATTPRRSKCASQWHCTPTVADNGVSPRVEVTATARGRRVGRCGD